MVYLDTSVVVPMFVREPASEAVLAWLESAGEALISSDWMHTEFASALALKVRSGAIELNEAREAVRELDRLCEAGLPLSAVSRNAFREAARVAGNPGKGVRAGDALHLAVARELGAQAVATADLALARGAEANGLRAIRF